MNYGIRGDTTKQRILESAACLFADKGYTETSIRELAKAAELKNPASLYYHFPSKNKILEHMLEDYSTYNNGLFKSKNINDILSQNPTTDGIIACLQTSFPPDRAEYYLKVLCVLMQEQFRNPFVRSFMANQFVLRSERNMRSIIIELKKIGALRKDIDYDYWTKATSSLFHSFATRAMLGIGDKTLDFVGLGMADMLRCTLDIMFEKCGEK